MSEEQGRAMLEPHLEGVSLAIDNGWAKWLEFSASRPPGSLISKRTRASLMHDFTTQELERYFVGAGIATSRPRSYLQVDFSHPALATLRFKKFRNGRLRTSGIPTQHRLAVEAQQVTLNGLHVTYVVAGYQVDAAGLELVRKAIACTIYDDVAWSIPLDLALVKPLTLSPNHELAAPVVRSVRPAKQAKVQNSKE